MNYNLCIFFIQFFIYAIYNFFKREMFVSIITIPLLLLFR